LYGARLGKGSGGTEWRTIYNGVETARYDAVLSVPSDAQLVFLGRLEPIKGAHHAIAIARAAGRRLVIAGNRVEASAEYFTTRIAPHLEAPDVTYLGAVDDHRKNALLGSAAALLMPVEWDEPFGLVMAEALACGTPVIGFARGSVPEIVRDGVNGYVARTVEEAAQAVPRLAAIDRKAVRADCEARFGDRVVVDGYERLYREMLAR
jgi:glycosyltransferase involved in cell wall biosynthesis